MKCYRCNEKDTEEFSIYCASCKDEKRKQREAIKNDRTIVAKTVCVRTIRPYER